MKNEPRLTSIKIVWVKYEFSSLTEVMLDFTFTNLNPCNACTTSSQEFLYADTTYPYR